MISKLSNVLTGATFVPCRNYLNGAKSDRDVVEGPISGALARSVGNYKPSGAGIWPA